MVRHAGRQEAIGVFEPGFMLGRKPSLTQSASWAVPAQGLASQPGFGVPEFTCSFATPSFSLPGFQGTEEFYGEGAGWEMEP